MEMDTIGEDEIGLLSEANPVVLPVEFISEHRTPYIFSQDTSVTAPGELEEMGGTTHFYVPITLVDEHHHLVPNETAFLIDPSQLSFLTSGTHVVKAAIQDTPCQEVPTNGSNLLVNDANILKASGFTLPDANNLVQPIQSTLSVPTISINGTNYQINLQGVSEQMLIDGANVGGALENANIDNSLANASTHEQVGSLAQHQQDPVQMQVIDKEQEQEGSLQQQPITTKMLDDLIVSPPLRKGPFTCEHCSKQYESWTVYKKHLKSHIDDKPHRCKICSATFNVPSNLLLHEATHNTNNLICPIKDCRKRFKRLASLKAHLTSHEQEESLFCTECGDEFNNQIQLDKHTTEHYQEWVKPPTKLYKCLHCERQYGKESVLKEHMKCHYKMKTSLGVRKHKRLRRGINLHECEICHKSFQKPSQLIRHKRIHTGEKPFKCDICSRGFNQKGSLKIHKLKHSGARPYQCEFCKAKFSQKGNLRAHVVRLHSIPRSEEVHYKCDQCTCVFRKMSRLNAHMNRAHQSRLTIGVDNVKEIIKGENINDSENKFLFEIGDFTTSKDSSDKENDDGHKNSNSSSDKSARIVKVVRQNAEGSLSTEQLLNNKPEIQVITRFKLPEILHSCTYCRKNFKKPSDLVRHTRIHTREKPYKCEHCFRSFAVRSTLTTHMRTHTGDKRFGCVSCKKLFSTPSSLKVHLKSHLREKRYHCKQCFETFSTLGERALHWTNAHAPVTLNILSTEATQQPTAAEEVLHQTVILPEPLFMTESGLVQVPPNPKAAAAENKADRPHKCSLCNMAFRKSSHLKIHERTHTGERPFKCDMCPRSFITNGILTAHKKVHLGIKSFICDDCGKSFATRSSLLRHKDTHALERPYFCPYCNKSYKSKIACKSHIKTHSAYTIAQLLQDQALKGQQSVGGSQTFLTQSNGNALGVNQSLDGDAEQKNAVDAMLISQNSFQISGVIEQGLSIAPSTLHAVSGDGETIMISNLPPSEGLSQESMREIEESIMNQQLFGLSSDKEQSVNHNTLFDQNFDHMVFSTIIPADQMSLEQVLPTSANLGSILADKAVQQSLEAVNVHLESEPTNEGDSGVSLSLADEPVDESTIDEANLITITQSENQKNTKPRCEVCDQTFNTQAQLRTHERNHGKKSWFDCALCGSSFTTAASLNRHTKAIHTDDKSFSCLHCSAAFRTELQLKRHTAEYHRSAESAGRRRVKGGRRGEARRLTEEETRRLVGQLPLAFATVSERVLIASVAEKQTVSDIKSPLSKQSKVTEVHRNRCKYCPKSFRKPSDLLRHHRTHTGERPYQCEFCAKSFTVKSTLDSHMKTHQDTKQFTCHVCGSEFATKGSLKVHMRLHTGSRPFRCPYCDLRFRTSGHRKAHLTLHSREGSVKPTSSGTDFFVPHDLDEEVPELPNENEHDVEPENEPNVENNDNFLGILDQVAIDCEDDNNAAQSVDLIASKMNSVRAKTKGGLVCNVCSKEFSKSSCLSRHMRIHTGEKPFKCDECGKMFNQKNAMQIHRQRHSGEKPYKCPECDVSLTQKGNLKTHLRRSHQFSPHTAALSKQQKVKNAFTLEFDHVIGEIFPPENTDVSVAV